MPPKAQTNLDYFEQRVFRPTTPCWNWRAYIGSRGYGTWSKDGRTLYAHRKAWELLVGPIPEGMEVHHRCFNRSCVNPEHLEIVTHDENIKATARLKTHCVHGHPFDEQNTAYTTTGHRQCLACRKDAGRRSLARKKEARKKRGPLPAWRRDDKCKNGHPRTPENTQVEKSGRRRCKDCTQAKYLKPGGYLDPNRQRASHCPHGHAYTPDNVYEYVKKGRTYFYCRECNRAAKRGVKPR